MRCLNDDDFVVKAKVVDGMAERKVRLKRLHAAEFKLALTELHFVKRPDDSVHCGTLKLGIFDV